MLMIQSMDGKLQIFEQNSQVFMRQLSDCLIPCPIAYIPQIDAFIINNYSCQLECYRYQVLASTQKEVRSDESKERDSTKTATSKIKGALVEWNLNLGEPCVQIACGCFSGTDMGEKYPIEILILCEQSIFLLKSSGAIIQQRRIEQQPSCMCVYKPSSSQNLSNFIVGYHDCTVQVFHHFNLVWSAKTSSIPVQLCIGSFGHNDGMIVLVDDGGHLLVSYLGSKPPVTSVVSHTRELDYDKIDEEHRELMKVIKDSQSERKTESTEKLLIRTQMARSFDNEYVGAADIPNDVVKMKSFLSSNLSDQQYVKISCRIYFSLTEASGDVDVSVVINVPNFVIAHPKSINIAKLSCTRSTPYMVKLNLFARTKYIASGLMGSISATFVSPASGEPRIVDHYFSIPLQLACRPKLATKNGTHKFTLETNIPPVSLTDLFDDFLRGYRDVGFDTNEVLGDTASKAIGFLFWSNDNDTNINNDIKNSSLSERQDGTIVSIIASKTAGRYRIHSDHLPAIYVVAAELERRLTLEINRINKESKQSDNSDYLITINDPFPVEDYFLVIQKHFSLRHNLTDIYSQLNDRAQQFRMIQKRLLTRYKDRNPSPLGALDTMLNETYALLLSLSDDAQDVLEKLLYIRNHIDAISNLVVLLIKLKYQISKGEQLFLQGLLCPESPETDEQVGARFIYEFIFIIRNFY